MKIYIPEAVAELHLFYGSLFTDYVGYPVIFQHLEAIVHKFWEGIHSKNPGVFVQINNYHPEYLGKSIDEMMEKDWTMDTCYETIASEYGFNNWNEVKDLGHLEYDLNFEEAVNNLLLGRYRKLKQQVEESPGLTTQRSQYGHSATLLHYAASNGVELWRQHVPLNLPQMTRYLLDNGADPHAKMKVYGGEYDVLSLLASSAHPFDAGISDEMKALFE